MSSCTICLITLSDDLVTNPNCGHVFHSECLRKWLKDKNFCPNCKRFARLDNVVDFHESHQPKRILARWAARAQLALDEGQARHRAEVAARCPQILAESLAELERQVEDLRKRMLDTQLAIEQQTEEQGQHRKSIEKSKRAAVLAKKQAEAILMKLAGKREAVKKKRADVERLRARRLRLEKRLLTLQTAEAMQIRNDAERNQRIQAIESRAALLGEDVAELVARTQLSWLKKQLSERLLEAQDARQRLDEIRKLHEGEIAIAKAERKSAKESLAKITKAVDQEKTRVMVLQESVKEQRERLGALSHGFRAACTFSSSSSSSPPDVAPSSTNHPDGTNSIKNPRLEKSGINSSAAAPSEARLSGASHPAVKALLRSTPVAGNSQNSGTAQPRFIRLELEGGSEEEEEEEEEEEDGDGQENNSGDKLVIVGGKGRNLLEDLAAAATVRAGSRGVAAVRAATVGNGGRKRKRAHGVAR